MSLLWMAAGDQPALQAAFDLDSSDFPTIVFINRPKMVYATHIGAFSPAALSKTLRAAQTGGATLR
eukprot:gene2819-23297_t